MALAFDRGRRPRLLVLPALFDEANKLRRLIAEVMRRLDLSGVDSFLPDFPGCNESREPLETQTLDGWRGAAQAAAAHFGATHVLAVRAGCLIAPAALPGWRYAPTTGAKVLRSLLRARTITAREAGRVETVEKLSVLARKQGVELAGWKIGSMMFSALEKAVANTDSQQALIDQGDIGKGSLWLRAEPGDDPEQADMLAALVAMGMLQS
ncbi:hypothetical protein [Allopontixanthobacter sp.]|uniref:hypothetical protein n=1 Tax=Allopontixanthobacter sp. TaxID=2906452 RepID=UPI002AB8D15D|nr:hypothetical protein [Allopontixanthobacter sp.]MDZ4308068.1 hypothetical protein [Allopontixanthobacter sp.]